LNCIHSHLITFFKYSKTDFVGIQAVCLIAYKFSSFINFKVHIKSLLDDFSHSDWLCKYFIRSFSIRKIVCLFSTGCQFSLGMQGNSAGCSISNPWVSLIFHKDKRKRNSTVIQWYLLILRFHYFWEVPRMEKCFSLKHVAQIDKI
jgi:hypothetical protein